MNINELIKIVEKKIKNQIVIESIRVEDKSFLHKDHKGNQKDKFHLKIIINSKELENFTKIENTKKIYKILDNEIKNFIHSVQILIN
tara:strand:- start:1976 stop:2236 length:261 start_codon:yes stop_codon:yes gene_type:complete